MIFILSDIIRNIERFQQQEEEEVAKLKSQLKHETGPGSTSCSSNR
jgi:hypothetical protein